MTKRIRLIIAAVVFLVIISAISCIFIFRPSESTIVEIVENNKVTATLDLSEETDRTFIIKCEGGYNEIKIENGQICITDADCPDKTCVKTGYLRSESVPIVCLPHRLVIRFAE